MTFFNKENVMENNTDQKKITRLLLLGFIAGIVALIGDLLLGWGTYDPALSGLARKLSIYDDISDTRIFWSALCGLIGITAEEIGCLATVFVNRYMMQTDPENALAMTIKFGSFFLLPGIIIFLLFFILQSGAHIYAFIKGLTPYPKWCFLFCVPVGMLLSVLIGKIGNYNITNAIRCAWISIGNLFMFLGLLIMEKSSVMHKI